MPKSTLTKIVLVKPLITVESDATYLVFAESDSMCTFQKQISTRLLKFYAMLGLKFFVTYNGKKNHYQFSHLIVIFYHLCSRNNCRVSTITQYILRQL